MPSNICWCISREDFIHVYIWPHPGHFYYLELLYIQKMLCIHLDSSQSVISNVIILQPHEDCMSWLPCFIPLINFLWNSCFSLCSLDVMTSHLKHNYATDNRGYQKSQHDSVPWFFPMILSLLSILTFCSFIPCSSDPEDNASILLFTGCFLMML